MSALETTLRTAALAATATLLAVLTTGAATAQARPGTAEGAELVKTGWWWAGNDTPLDETVVAPPQPSPPNVPKGTLPVSAAGGEPEKYSALEFRLDARPGAYVESAVLVLRESTEPGASVNADGATVLACPVTESFWADGAAASWKARPAYDCDLASATGERDAEKGLWTFDLTAIASLWAAKDRKGSTSVALVEGVEAPEGFQVAFDGPGLEGVGFRFVTGRAPALPPLAGAGLPSTTNGSAGPVSTTSGAGAGSPLASTGSSGGSAPLGDTADVAPVGDLPATAADPAAPVDPAAAEPATAATTPVAAPAAVPAWYSGIPAAGFVLVPFGLGLAYLLMLALGPDAQPAAGPARHGVARALERLRAAGGALNARGLNARGPTSMNPASKTLLPKGKS